MIIERIERLPPHLSERCRVISDADVPSEGRYILYWMHHAVRVDENPALDSSVLLAEDLDRPVLVYSSLTAAHPYASDRHHTFAIEGLREVEGELERTGVRFAFHLGRRRDESAPLTRLARDAALIVVEDYPAPPYPSAVARLARLIDVPIVAVDSHCVVPMQSVGKPYQRAFQFRKKIAADLDRRVAVTWPRLEPPKRFYEDTVPFEPVILQEASIPDLCADSEIDHSIGPVSHSRGGATSGYSRWDEFRWHGLKDYAKLRNDPTVPFPKGVSRLSPYLHFGHVSAFRIAREAQADGSDGAEKYLDELITWRELAFNLCFHRDDVESLTILPGWARATLEKHADDLRETTFSWERLARAKTGSPLWDAAQTSLLRHGELHNNVRMTWGKEILKWTSDPESALAMLIDLNHRYALDGSDPASYGGLLWCMGLFDRPFGPERPITGIVRPRSIERHAARLDLDQYSAHVQRPASGESKSIAVVGAGLAGLIAARTLQDHGHRVSLFDKARGPGGRMASRRADGLTFDHGAQYFTVSDDHFARHVQSWQEDSLVAPWHGRLAVRENGQLSAKESDRTRYVGIPRMSALTRQLSDGLEITFGAMVTGTSWSARGWSLNVDDQTTGQYDALVLTTPPEQAVPLLESCPDLAEKVGSVRMQPCWASMLTFENALPTDFDGIFVNEGPLSWVARNSSKPGRGGAETWILHASPSWSEEHVELEKDEVAAVLIPAFFEALQVTEVKPDRSMAHRWRYALAENSLDQCLWEPSRTLVVAGDWTMGSKVEGAFLSGMAAAGRILGSF